ncbi:MAG: hypothetical protein R3B57_06505 [Phycisphaerales bacterium]
MRSEDKPADKSGGGAGSRRKRRRGRRLLIGFGVVVVLVFVLVALAPKIASGVAPGIIESKVNAKIAGRVEVRGVSLSWGGPLRVESVHLFDPAGAEAADVSVRTDAGLLGLLTGNLNLGEVIVSGWASVEPGPDGTSAIERASAPSTPTTIQGTPSASGGGSTSIPKSLRASVKLDTFEVRTGAGDVVLDATAGLTPGQPVKVALTGSEGDKQVMGLDATLTGLVGADGSITLSSATLDAQGWLAGAPTAILDVLAPLNLSLVELLGDRLDAGVNAKGTMDDLGASFSIESAGVSAEAAVKKTGQNITQDGVISVRADGARVARALPSLRQALIESASIDVQAWPEVTLEVEGLRAGLDSIEKGDYRGLGAHVRVVSTPTRALVPTSGGGVERGTLEVSGLELTLDAPDLAGAVSVKGGASATLDGKDAGELAIALNAPTLLGEGGALLDPGSAPVSGSVTLSGVAAQTIQPFVEGTGLVVTRDLGDEVTVHATASRAGGDSNHVALSLESAKVGAALDADVVGRVIRGSAKAGSVTLREPGPTIAGLLGDSSVTLASAQGPLTLTIESLVVDLDRVMGSGGVDLRGVNATASADVPGGAVRIGSGEGSHLLGVHQLTINVDASDLAKGVSASANAQAVVDGNPGGTVSIVAHAGDLFDAKGAITGEAASLGATVTLTGVPASAAQAFTPSGTLDVASDIGPTIDATIVADKKAGGDAPINLDVNAGGTGTRVTGALAYDATGVRTRGDGLLIKQNGVGRLVNRLGVLPLEAKFERVSSAVEVRVASLTVPMLDGSANLAGASLGASVSFAGGSGTFGDGGTFRADSLAASLKRDAGKPATCSLTLGTLEVRSKTGEAVAGSVNVGAEAPWAMLVEGQGGVATLDAKATLSEPGGGSRLGEITINATAPIRQAGGVNATARGSVESLARVEKAIGREGVLTGALGQSATFDATLTADAFDPADPMASWDVSASIESPRLKTQGPIKASARDGVVRLNQPAKASWTVDPAWATTMALGKDSKVKLDKPIAMDVRVDRLEAPIEGSGRPVIEAAFKSDAVSVAMEDGSKIEYTGLDATAKTASDTGVIDVKATMVEKGAAADAPKAVEVVASVSGLGEAGSDPVVTGYANLRNTPTAFIDAATGMNGKLLGLLGDRSSAHVRARGLSKSAGELTMSLATTNTKASYEGRVKDGSLVSTKPTELTVNAVTKDFGFELAKVIPVFGSIEKTAGTDAPATVVIDTLSLPVDGRDFVSNLSAAMRITPGDATLKLAGGLGKFLKGGDGLKIGRRMPGFPVNVDKGAVSYDGVQVPVGEFALNVSGKVDLVNKTQDVRVGVPAGGLAAEAAGGEGAIGRIFDQALGVSLVNKGPMGQQGWELKLGGGGQDRKPGDAIRDIFKGIGGGG